MLVGRFWISYGATIHDHREYIKIIFGYLSEFHFLPAPTILMFFALGNETSPKTGRN